MLYKVERRCIGSAVHTLPSNEGVEYPQWSPVRHKEEVCIGAIVQCTLEVAQTHHLGRVAGGCLNALY